ncbi:MAG: hypothetical protein CND89_02870 [Marine Group II euryarchaeote MED-G38]|nr:hypothetical protein [Euryarchaeota archaeon]OUV26081.1 MAG: hypothetical protein CBC57_03120 [Euryarchaeota archaeon TMED97]PDH23005.1 MAG: hypothetical protein CND89_02870 [Marine Group II euryarchaeote MED-G38]
MYHLTSLPHGSEFLLLISAISASITWWTSNFTKKIHITKFFAWLGVSSMVSLLIWILGDN